MQSLFIFQISDFRKILFLPERHFGKGASEKPIKNVFFIMKNRVVFHFKYLFFYNKKRIGLSYRKIIF